MLKSILEALYYGNIIPNEIEMRHNSAYIEIMDKLNNEVIYLKSKLSSENWKHFENFDDLFNKAANYAQTEIFSRGFTLGALLIFEIMERKEDMINP